MTKDKIKQVLKWLASGFVIALDDGRHNKGLYYASYVRDILMAVRMASTGKKDYWANLPPVNNSKDRKHNRYYIVSEKHYNKLKALAEKNTKEKNL